jgi:hypothetical protein
MTALILNEQLELRSSNFHIEYSMWLLQGGRNGARYPLGLDVPGGEIGIGDSVNGCWCIGLQVEPRNSGGREL